MAAPPLLRALRPHQWVKNAFVLAPLVFAAADRRPDQGVESAAIGRTLLAFAAFCLAASAVYLANDVLDAPRDRLHPEKRRRPVAAGGLGAGTALGASLVLAAGALALALLVPGEPWPVAPWIAAYLILNALYGLWLKAVVLLDVFCIATGFVLRVAAGGVAAHAEVSHWLFLCTFLLALFLGFSKRRAELAALAPGAVPARANLREYSLAFLDQMTGVLAACTIVCYTMYTVDPATIAKFGAGSRLVWTVPFVAFGIGRYMLLVQDGRAGEKPTRVLLGGDGWFLLNLLAWAGTVGFALFLR
ncbi:MAG: UbiA family prenyltransferase [Planctomycetota bacterium]